MKVQAENYKGIDFIRISKLPEIQRSQIKQSLSSEKVIRILKDGELISDCVQYKHYESWYKEYSQTVRQIPSLETPKAAINIAID